MGSRGWWWSIVSTLLVGITTLADSKSVINSAKMMEQRLEVKITSDFETIRGIRSTQRIADNYSLIGPHFAPDGTALAWSSYPIDEFGKDIPFLTVATLRNGVQTVSVEGLVSIGCALSSRAEIIVAIGISYNPTKGNRRALLAIDRRHGGTIHDLTQSVHLELGNNLEMISVSGPGNLVALGDRPTKQIKVFEIASGRTVYSTSGRFPRLSPDGTQLAYVNEDIISIHSFSDGTTRQLTRINKVSGIGAWSPDGRFLLAGALPNPPAPTRDRINWLAFPRDRIIVDAINSEWAVIGKLWEGDYGTGFAWISTKLLERFSTK